MHSTLRLRRPAPARLVLAWALLAPFASHPAAAQTASQNAAPATPPPAGTAAGASDEIVVTARREAENIQSTPVSVSAFNADMLRSANITTTADLQLKTPGVFLGGSGARENSVFQIRGQSKALSGTNAAAVVSYFADVPAPTTGSGVVTYDMASVQVLKGPQGTLFGRNTTGGAVLYYPVAPGYDLGGYVEGTYGRFDRRVLEGAVSVPIADQKLAVRVAGRYEKMDGYTRNIVNDERLDNVNSRAFRVSLLAEPADGIRNLTIFDWYYSHYNGDSIQVTDVFGGPSLLSSLGLEQSAREELAAQRARGPRKVASDTQPGDNRSRRWGITNRTDIDLTDAVSFTNIFGYRKTFLNFDVNTDGLPRLASTFGGTMPLLNAATINHTEQYTDEVQLKGKLLDDKVDWLLGGFYLKSRPYAASGFGNDVGFNSSFAFASFQYSFYTETSRAVFGNANVRLDSLLSGLRFNAGLRYTWDEERSCTANQGTYAAPNTAIPDVQPGECPSSPLISGAAVVKAKSNAPTWTVGFDWQANDKLFLYVVSRRGYRTGGVNTPTLGGRLIPLQTFGPERVTDVEAGFRSDWQAGDVRLRLNMSAFAGYYDGVQVALSGLITQAGCTPGAAAPISPDGDCDPTNDPQAGTLLANAGKSRVAGIDYDGRIAFGRRLSFTFGGNFLDTKTRALSAAAILTPYLPPSGELPFNFVAKTTYTLGMRYEVPLQDGSSLAFSGDYYHTSRMRYVDSVLPAYGVASFRLDWDGALGSRVDLSAYVTNAFDKDYQQTGALSGRSLGLASAIYGAPRQFGVTARYRFGGK